MLEDSRFSLDPAGSAAMPNPLELPYRSGAGDAWYETPQFYWFGMFGLNDDVGIGTFLIRPNLPPAHQEQWSGIPWEDGRWNIRMGPMSFMPVGFGVYAVEIRIEGMKSQVQRFSIAPAA